ncbi:integrase core domain-containing protein [Metarhizium brunneum]
MDNGSTEWANGIMEVTLAMNTQKHSTIGCAPVELLFRERTSYIDWLNQQKRVDPTIGVAQEDSTEPPINTLSPSTPTPSPAINIGVGPGSSQITVHISPEAALGSEINVRISSPTQSCSNYESEKEQTGLQNTDQVIAKAQKATQKAKLRMMQKYSKQHTIQHFNIGDIFSIKVPREDRTSTDNRRLFGRILEEPYAHRYRILTTSGVIKRLIPTKGLSAVNDSLWPDITIPRTTKEVTLTEAARDASTSARVWVSCQSENNTRYETSRPSSNDGISDHNSNVEADHRNSDDSDSDYSPSDFASSSDDESLESSYYSITSCSSNGEAAYNSEYSVSESNSDGDAISSSSEDSSDSSDDDDEDNLRISEGCRLEK